MSKIICDICGTSYPETADRCPICGYSRELNGDNVLDNQSLEPEAQEADIVTEEVKVTAEAVPVPAVKESKKFVDKDDDDDDDDYDDDEDEDDEDEDEPRSNTFLVVILVILIVALLAVSGFIFVKYFLPTMGGESTEPTGTAAPSTSVSTEATTEPRIACIGLTMTSEASIVLEEEGAEWLINVIPAPENTTDKILYSSSDESVVTVNEAGKLTAVGQGEAVITITCGDQLMQCNVACFFIQETTEPTGTTAPAQFEDETTAPTDPEETTEPEKETAAPTEPEKETTAPTEPEETTEPEKETTAPTEPAGSDITLTLSRTDISFSVVPAYYTLEIKEDYIKAEDVKWSSSNGSIVIVHNGKLQIVGWGTCKVYAKYKDVVAECIVRVVPR